MAKSSRKYNWEKLRAEFIAGEWLSIAQFFKDKKISISNQKRTVGWVDAKKKHQKEVFRNSSKQLMDGEIQNIVEIRNRQARLARFLQLKGMNALQAKDVQTVEDARKLVVSGMDEERRVVGMDGAAKQSFTQINIGPKTNLDKLVEKMDYEELLGLIAQLKRERAGRSLPNTASESGSEIEEGEVV
jgi:hypothetical protein